MIQVAGYSATGPRDANEDRFYVKEFSGIGSFTNGITSFVLVSDGMGGYLGGDMASQAVVDEAERYISRLLEDLQNNSQVELDAPLALKEIATYANEAILATSKAQGNGSMGATYLAAFLSDTHAWIGHVGDSRAYLIRHGEARQLTQDHSQVGRLLSEGVITEEQAQNHPARNRIERALGFGDATPDVQEVDLQFGDVLLLCSDGVYTVLKAPDLAEYVYSAKSLEGCAKKIVKAAVRSGTDDNSTVVLAAVGEASAPLAGAVANAGTATRPKQPTQAMDALPVDVIDGNSPDAAMERYVPRSQKTEPPAVSGREQSVFAGRSRTTTFWIGFGLGALALAFVLGIIWLVVGCSSGETTAGLLAANDGALVEPAETGAEGASGADRSEQSPFAERGSTNRESADTQSAAATSQGTDAGGAVLAGYAATDGATLKYVDSNGMAQNFSASDPSIVEGTLLQASRAADSYQRANRSYRSLDPGLLESLEEDLGKYQMDPAAYASGARQFAGSSLAPYLVQEDYVSLLQSLSQAESPDIAFLIVDADRLTPTQSEVTNGQ